MENKVIEVHLKNFANTFSHFSYFEATPEYSLISQSLESILRASLSIQGFNLTLKLILSGLVDSIWNSINHCEAAETIEKKAAVPKMIKTKSQSVVRSGKDPLQGVESRESSAIPRNDDLRTISELSFKAPSNPRTKRGAEESRDKILEAEEYRPEERQQNSKKKNMYPVNPGVFSLKNFGAGKRRDRYDNY